MVETAKNGKKGCDGPKIYRQYPLPCLEGGTDKGGRPVPEAAQAEAVRQGQHLHGIVQLHVGHHVGRAEVHNVTQG